MRGGRWSALALAGSLAGCAAASALVGCASNPPPSTGDRASAASAGSGRSADFDEDAGVFDDLLAGLFASFAEDRAELIRGAALSDDADTRQAATRAIAAADWGGLPSLLALYRLQLRDPDPTVRAAGVGALALHGDAGDVPAVAAQLREPDAFLRWEAAKALRFLSGEAAVPPLLDAVLGDEDVGTRVAAAEALARHRRRDVFEALRTALVDTDFAVAAAARESLKTLTGRDAGAEPDAWGELSNQLGPELFAEAKPYQPRVYEEPPGFFRRLLGAD